MSKTYHRVNKSKEDRFIAPKKREKQKQKQFRNCSAMDVIQVAEVDEDFHLSFVPMKGR